MLGAVDQRGLRAVGAQVNLKMAACPPRPSVFCRAQADRQPEAQLPDLSRRDALLAVPGFILSVELAKPRRASASLDAPAAVLPGGYRTFKGYSQAPDLYMGYGQASDAPPLYSFEYPATWEEETVTKTDKSTMGMDGMVKHPKTRKEQAYVIALGGKDYRDSVLKDAQTSLIVVAGGDPDLRQALTDGKVKQSQTTLNGTLAYVFDITSDKRHFLSTVAKHGDTVIGLVVGAPTSAWAKDGDDLRHIQETFKLL